MMLITDFVARALSIAESRGLSTTNNVLLTVSNGQDYTWIIVAHTEPTSDVAPLNAVWIPADTASPDHGSALRRSSRTPTGSYTHSWALISDYGGLTAETPFWDTPQPAEYELISHVADISNPHGTESSGGLAEGEAVIIRAEPTDGYLAGEAVPKSWIEDIIQYLDTQVSSVKQALNYLLNQINGLKGRVTTLENNGWPDGHLHVQEEPAKTWSLTHPLNTDKVMVAVYDPNQRVVYPSKIEVTGIDTVEIAFAVPMTGEVNVRPL